MSVHKTSFGAEIHNFVFVEGKDAMENRIVPMVQMS